MPTAAINAFDGLKPIVDPIMLDDGGATVATNVKLTSGSLNPLKGTTVLKAMTNPGARTIFRYGSSQVETEFWLEFTERTDVMRSPITDNQYGMLYWADGVEPRYAPQNLIVSGQSYPGASYKLGVPAPTVAPEVSGTAPTAATQTVSLTAVYTYVTAYGEEGPPSPPSALATIDASLNITVGSLGAAPSGAYNFQSKNIYLSSTTGSGTEFQFWRSVPVAQSSVTGAYKQSDLGETLPSFDWVAPPATLRGLRMMANGIAVGFVQNTAYASEPNLPHAWPHQYPADHRIVAVGTFGQSAAFLTDAYPYILSGVDPAAMTFEKVPMPQACVSIDSIVETGNAVYYASPDGLVVIGDGAADVVTKTILSREQWQAYNPSSIKASLYEGRYIATYQRVEGTRGMLIFDFSGQGAVMTECNINTGSLIEVGSAEISAMYHDPRTDTLYLAQAGSIRRFDAGSALSYVWRSKVFRTPSPINFSFGQVIADAYPVVMRVYADGQLKQTKSVTSSEAFRLVSGFRSRNWQIELIASTRITQALISTSIGEIRAI